MRILKYLFLLLLLSLVALSIFIATQKGNFTVERSKIINSPKSSLFSYVNDYKNWKDWNSIAVGDSLIQITYSQITAGKASFCSWDGKQGQGDLRTINIKENENIIQTMNFNGSSAETIMSFKDTLGKTKVTWKAEGKMGFVFKALSVFNGGANTLFEVMFENSLNNLDKKLDYEINSYSVKVNGVTNLPQINYLAQTFTSEFSKVNKNSEIVFSKITLFCENNNIKISGKPFIIYHTYDTVNELTKLSICIPIENPIFISEGSDLSSKTLPSLQVLKTTLIGDYSHLGTALNKSQKHLNKNYLSLNPLFSHIAIYTIGKKEINNPSKWITEIYYPVKQKLVPRQEVITTPSNQENQPKTEVQKELPSEF